MSIRTHIAGVYQYTASLRVQSWYIRKYGKRVARLKEKIHQQHHPKRREKLEQRYKYQMEKLNEAIQQYQTYKRHAEHHLASLKTEY